MNSAQVGIAQMQGQKKLANGVIMTSFNAFTGGSILEFKLNSGKENPFFANFFAINVVNGKGTPSALNDKKVNPVLLAVVATKLGKMKIRVAKQEEKTAGLKLFLEPKPQAVPVDWAKLELAPPQAIMDEGFGTPEDNLHG